MADNQPIIMIRRIKKVEAGHHGGAWKVAYADFVTAMMAFFLLLWLLNVTTDIERKGIADYFAPASLSKSESGAGGALGGQSVTVEGGAMGYESPPTVEERTIATAGLGEEGQQDTPGK
ncbi:MAG: chemotaxis protein MotB, partial [Alphaproteobacteria bacterium]|nr:chemotaxis protein MotB [Alphaproteobacteria bacterium]